MFNPSKSLLPFLGAFCCLSACLLSGGGSVLLAKPEQLSELDREQLLKKLEQIEETADATSQLRFGTALQAFKEAAQSDTRSYELFLKCCEKVNFDDEQRKSQDFREWKRKHQEKTDSPGFRRALRHQLNWLLLTIEASANPEDMQELGVRAMGKVDQLFADHELLRGNEELLKKSVLNSVFAKSYNLNGLQAENWPLFPLDLEKIYEQIAMPPLRNAQEVDRLRGAWLKRIEHEGLIRMKWGKLPKGTSQRTQKDLIPAEFYQWKDDDYLKLLWKKEVDCFKQGDEKVAASHLLAHLEKHLHHKLSLEWIAEFTKLMAPQESPAL